MKILRLAVAVGVAAMLCANRSDAQTILVQESFEDSNYASRGWYDSTGGALSSVEKFAGAKSFECRFGPGGTNCAGGDIARHALTPTDSIYLAYYIKHTANWVGSTKAYHPHTFTFATNLDGAYAGLAYTHLTAYVENNYQLGGQPWFSIQDGMNIDETKINVDLTRVTENRAIGGCNGDSDGYGLGQCYPAGSVHWNGKTWSAGQNYFVDSSSSPHYKGNWHLVEAYFKLNSVSGGVGVNDGVIRYWYDGALIYEKTNLVMRTGAHPTAQFNQLALFPYIGDGSPVDQTIWIDNLTVATGRPAVPPPPPNAPAPPTNLRIIR